MKYFYCKGMGIFPNIQVKIGNKYFICWHRFFLSTLWFCW